MDGTRVAVDNDDEVLLVVGGNNEGSGGAGHRVTNKTFSTSVDDPVYDQVSTWIEFFGHLSCTIVPNGLIISLSHANCFS